MQLIADELIRLEIVDYITDTTVCETLKKNEIKPWLVEEWCIPEVRNCVRIICNFLLVFLPPGVVEIPCLTSVRRRNFA